MPLIGALVVKEFQTWLRGRLTFAAFTMLVLLVAALVFLLGMLILAPDANAAPASFSTTSTTSTNILVANRAIFLFGAVGLCIILAAAIVAPAVSASAFATERERGTLDLLLLQGPGSARIVLGKVLAALLFSLLLLAVGIPFFAPAWSFGGVQADQVIALVTILCTATLFFCAVGVFCGAVLNGALQAAFFAQAIALFVVFGTLGLHLAFAIVGGNDMFRPLLWLNPFLALLSGGGAATDAFARGAPIAYRTVLSLPPQSWAPGLLLPAWVIASLAWTALGVLFVIGAAIAIEPTHPMKGEVRPVSLLSPTATYHAELREQLGGVGRALFLQRAPRWFARGLVIGLVLVLGLVAWAWTRDGMSSLPLVGLIALPVAIGLGGVIASLFIRYQPPDLARRVDSAAHLQERSTTALELGARGAEHPLALAQMRDAVEHLQRVDLFSAFPLRAPRTELLTAFFVGVVAIILAVSPNPWLLRARAADPAISIAQEQAQRVQRLADSIQPQDSAELEALRQLVSKGARTIEARSTEPDAALNSLQDLEEQVRSMSAGDDQLAAALSAIAGALAADPATQQLASAINTGDMREISRATRDLAQASDSLSGQDRERVARTLRDAANRAGRVSQPVAGDLSDAANALQAGAGESGGDAGMQSGGTQTQAGQTGQGQPSSSNQAQNGRSASDALNQLSSSAAAAGERQRAANQLESSRNALERALGRTQSRSGSSGRSTSGQRNQASAGAQAGEQSPGAGQGQTGEQGDGADAAGGGAPGNDQGEGGDTGQGGGYSTGGQSQNRTGQATTGLDAITRPEQVPNGGGAVPDESSTNPYLGEAGEGASRTADEAVQPSFSRKSTTGNETSAIPLGLRDLVKDYFSSLDQNQK